jgi:tetratricopeptide (TPR) repeat protein
MKNLFLKISFLVLIFTGTSAPVFAQTDYSDAERDLEKASDKLYVQADRRFKDGKYWEAARDLIVLLDFYPRYSRIDEATYILADCLYEIGLNDGANKLYRHLVKNYVRSPYLPNALLGLQRVKYDQHDYVKSLEFFKVVDRTNPPEHIHDASRYIAGLCYQRLHEYSQAVTVLSAVSDNSPFYPYALYTLAINHLRLKNVRQAIESFRRIRKLSITNTARKRVLDETHLTLGYIYYELGYYQQALNEFNDVSPDHSSHQDALLAAGWASIKLERFKQATLPLTELVANDPTDELAEEGLFLLGRCYLKMGLYSEALSVYENLINIFPRREVIPNMVNEINLTLEAESIKMERIKLDLLMLETKLLDMLEISSEQPMPEHIQQEQDRIAEARIGLLKRIREERETFEKMSYLIDKMKRRTEVKQDRRDWRAYAEYGRTRAKFLKEIQDKDNKAQVQ